MTCHFRKDNRFNHSSLVLFIMAALGLFLPGGTASMAAGNTNAPPKLAPGPNDGRIAYITARLLEEYHYSEQPLDRAMSERFFDGYLNSLDPQRIYFLKSDVTEFSHYRTNLHTLTINNRDIADLKPAYEIFSRFLERLQQRVAYEDKLLKRDRLPLNTHQSILLDRRDAPYPKNLAEARQLWQQRLIYDYLQEVLARTVSNTNSDTAMSLPKTASREIYDKLIRHYHWQLRLFTSWDGGDVLQTYLNALTHAYDPHSDYLNVGHAQDFSIDMNLALFGIGAELRSEDGYCTIYSLVPGGPAAKSKQIKPKDRIIAVAQGKQIPVDVVDMDLGKIVQMIRGPKGTEVRLTLIPVDDSNSHRVVTLIRDEIKLEGAKAQLFETPDGHGGTNRLGVIDLPSFYATVGLPGNNGDPSKKSTTADVKRLIQKLEQEKVAGIILDLRNNGGGSLEEAVDFTGLFITNGPVVLVRAPEGRVDEDKDTSKTALYRGPLVVLVNRFSASATEIVAGALQDYGRALIVGDTSTYGKGTVQNLNPLRPFIWTADESVSNDPGTVKITIRKFYRVSGASTQLKGVTPDIVLPDTLNVLTDIGESSLPNAMSWDTIPKTDYTALNLDYTPLGLVEPYLSQLRKMSDERVDTNQDFVYIRQDIDQTKKLQADKTASLNEEELLKQAQQNLTRQKTREAERNRRQPPNEKIYEITLDNVNERSLPPLIWPTNIISAAVSTNKPVVTTNTPPPIDPWLDETEHILENYVSLMDKNRRQTTNQ
jgi:carboxyl-terminal processing protease